MLAHEAQEVAASFKQVTRAEIDGRLRITDFRGVRNDLSHVEFGNRENPLVPIVEVLYRTEFLRYAMTAYAKLVSPALEVTSRACLVRTVVEGVTVIKHLCAVGALVVSEVLPVAIDVDDPAIKENNACREPGAFLGQRACVRRWKPFSCEVEIQ